MNNSGLGRFGYGFTPYMLPQYTPQNFQAPGMDFRNRIPMGRPAVTVPGILPTHPMGEGGSNEGASASAGEGGFSGFGNMGPGGSSALGNLGLSPTTGFAVGGIPGGLLGLASQAAHAADPTNPSSVNAVNGLDAGFSMGPGPGADAATNPGSIGAQNGSDVGFSVGGEGGEGGGK
jgi:hypothetical protein